MDELLIHVEFNWPCEQYQIYAYRRVGERRFCLVHGGGNWAWVEAGPGTEMLISKTIYGPGMPGVLLRSGITELLAADGHTPFPEV